VAKLLNRTPEHVFILVSPGRLTPLGARIMNHTWFGGILNLTCKTQTV
jgi:hypothetical protein